MSEENKDILRISLDELSAATTSAIVLSAPAEQTAAKSYGSIHEAAAPEILSQEKGSIFLKAWVYLGLAGLVGAMVGWGIVEPGFVDGQKPSLGQYMVLPLIVTLMCTGFALAESIVERSARKAAIRVGISLPLGIVLGFILNLYRQHDLQHRPRHLRRSGRAELP